MQQLHRDEALPVPFVDVEDGADVGMIQRRGQPRLALETPDRVHVPRQRRRQELDCDRPRQPRVLRLVDDAHAAAAERADDVEV